MEARNKSHAVGISSKQAKRNSTTISRVSAETCSEASQTPQRGARVERKTRETSVAVTLALDGSGRGEARTGVPFLDHMLESFARHGFFDLTIKAAGDLHIDDHHTVEDVGIVLGRAFREALGDRSGIRRFGEASVPMYGG